MVTSCETGNTDPLKTQAQQQDFECFFERYLRFLRSQPPDYGLPAASAVLRAPTGQQLRGAQRLVAALPRVFDPSLRRNPGFV